MIMYDSDFNRYYESQHYMENKDCTYVCASYEYIQTIIFLLRF